MSHDSAPTIRLAQFLKWKGIADSGGEAKVLIQEGLVSVNDEVETRRGRQLRNGDRSPSTARSIGSSYPVQTSSG